MKAAILVPRKDTHLRLGSYGLDETLYHIPSDTLFSGLLNSLAILYGDSSIKKFLAATMDKRLLISSAFPRIEIFHERNSLAEWFFFPKPLIWFEKKETPNERSSDEEIQKKVQKKIKYVEKRLLDKMLADVEEKDEIIKTNFSITSTEIFPLFGRMAILEQALSSLGSIAGIGDDQAKNNLLEELKKLDLSPFTDITIQKVTIDRLTNASEPYAQTDLFLLERNLQINSDVLLTLKPTFFFLYQIPEELEGKFRGALSFLAEEGIGGGRSQGSGVFNETKFRDIDIFIKGNEFSINLSLLFPEKSEINRVVAYELILRGGYITSGRGTQFIKNQVRMLKEGSVFRGIPKGSTPVVSTNTVSGTIGHPVYQYGLNFPLSFGG